MSYTRDGDYILSPLLKGGGDEVDGGLPNDVLSYLPRDKKFKDRSRELRKNATSQENHLWYDFLKSHIPRFTRQRIIGEYITDFFCYEAMLVVELDGSQHYTVDGVAYDEERTAYLNALGIQVLRFENKAVDRDFKGVCHEISCVVTLRKSAFICQAINYRKSGGEFLTAEQSLANMQAVIKAGAEQRGG